MRPADQLAAFVSRALAAGNGRAEIRDALTRAGWSEAEIDGALAAWADGSFRPPVPRPRTYLSGREALLYGLMFVALALTAGFLVSLFFEIIERTLGAATSGPGLSDQIRWAISYLVVTVPLFLGLHLRLESRSSRRSGRRRSDVRMTFGHVTLFVAALVLLVDLAVAVYSFLSGELTIVFVLKTLTVAAVAGAILLYFGRLHAPDVT